MQRAHLVEHYQRNYIAENCTIFISGKITEEVSNLLNKHLGRGLERAAPDYPQLPAYQAKPQKLRIAHPDNVQTAVRIGRKLFNRHHPDFNGFFVLSTILGGYFGSRLMTNIREDKGFTYNIFSTLDTMHHDGCFYIGTEVGNAFLDATLKETYREINRLREELIEEKELGMVRSYLLGNLLTMLDGPFNVMDVVKNTVMEKLPFDSFQSLAHTIKNIQPETLRDLAQRYLDPDDLWEVVVG